MINSYQDYELSFLEEEKKDKVLLEPVYSMEKLPLPGDEVEMQPVKSKMISQPSKKKEPYKYDNYAKYLISMIRIVEVASDPSYIYYSPSRNKIFRYFIREVRQEFLFTTKLDNKKSCVGFRRLEKYPIFNELYFIYEQEHDPMVLLMLGFMFYIQFRLKLIKETFKIRDRMCAEAVSSTREDEEDTLSDEEL
jgi:hypothetical protein